MEDLLAALAKAGVAAPAPIEQRWTASSRSPMSPASAPGAPDTVHSWVGIIMYLPTEDPAQRAAVTDKCGSPKRVHTRGWHGHVLNCCTLFLPPTASNDAPLGCDHVA